jgi:hypothetical protein
MKTYANESIFDRVARERGLTEDQIEAWIEWIRCSYDGPLYTRTGDDEVEDCYRRWMRGLLSEVLDTDGLSVDLGGGE